MKLGMALLRITVGVLFMGHGLQKLKGWFSGHGLEATAAGFEKLGLRPGKVQATAGGTAETAGGAMLAGGLATPVAASMLSGVMTVAIDKVHKDNGPWVANNGYEYNLVMMAAVFAIASAGPGPWSLDERLGIGRSGAGVGLAQLAAGLLGAATVIRLGSRGGAAAEAEPAASEEAAPEPEPVAAA
ncbi:MAG TPA: DoxX family protein [Thermoleophilaceae bacterium]|jgi:putative oxidoreductase